ncbi:uncharacterized protein LOC102356174 [Latimeria chalumnae]|uniref:uncharacterized protein LOC102356174 n=1 Tax=Latimeria chalumnae TaxID=7897 RepID=UPI0003C1480B
MVRLLAVSYTPKVTSVKLTIQPPLTPLKEKDGMVKTIKDVYDNVRYKVQLRSQNMEKSIVKENNDIEIVDLSSNTEYCGNITIIGDSLNSEPYYLCIKTLPDFALFSALFVCCVFFAGVLAAAIVSFICKHVHEGRKLPNVLNTPLLQYPSFLSAEPPSDYISGIIHHPSDSKSLSEEPISTKSSNQPQRFVLPIQEDGYALQGPSMPGSSQHSCKESATSSAIENSLRSSAHSSPGSQQFRKPENEIYGVIVGQTIDTDQGSLQFQQMNNGKSLRDDRVMESKSLDVIEMETLKGCSSHECVLLGNLELRSEQGVSSMHQKEERKAEGYSHKNNPPVGQLILTTEWQGGRLQLQLFKDEEVEEPCSQVKNGNRQPREKSSLVNVHETLSFKDELQEGSLQTPPFLLDDTYEHPVDNEEVNPYWAHSSEKPENMVPYLSAKVEDGPRTQNSAYSMVSQVPNFGGQEPCFRAFPSEPFSGYKAQEVSPANNHIDLEKFLNGWDIQIQMDQ